MADRSRTLFVRLLIYFLIVLLLPLLVFSGYYLFLGDRSQSKYLSEQSLGVIRRDALIVGNVLEEYRHKAYLLSTDELIVEVMKHDSPEFLNRVIHEVYPLLFSVMKGDTYLASANLVSNTGRIRLSTHAFPKMFDLRYHTSTSELNSVIAQNLNQIFISPNPLKKFPSPAQNILKNLLLIPTALPSPLTMVMIMKTLKKF